MLSPAVWLGLVGDLASCDAPPEHYTTRIGGLPVFPGPNSPGWATTTPNSSPKCRVCGASLSLVLQAYAPLPQLAERVILLMGCTAAGCGNSKECWQAVRCQLQPKKQPDDDHNHHQQQQQQQKQGQCQAPPSPTAQQAQGHAAPAAGGIGFGAGDDWGFGASGSGSGFDAGSWDQPQATNADAFDFSDLTASLAAAAQHQHQHQQQQEKQKKQQRKQQQDGLASDVAAAGGGGGGAAGSSDAAAAATASSKGTAGPVLPEFYLYAELEPDASSTKAMSSKERQHVQQLLAAYESVEAATTSTATPGSSGSSGQRLAAAAAAAAAGGSGAAEGEGEGALWAGEEYEADSVRCMQRSYLKFMKRLARSPQQCVRYCHNGPLLWPQSRLPQPPACPRCGSRRVFELQLMPPLSQMVLEAAGMMQEQGLSADAAVVNSVANWDWCTVAVFTCESSCSGEPLPEGGCELSQEEVVLVSEADCESQAGSQGAAPVPRGPTAEAELQTETSKR